MKEKGSIRELENVLHYKSDSGAKTSVP